MEFVGLVLGVIGALQLMFSLSGVADKPTKITLNTIISGASLYMIGLLVMDVSPLTAVAGTGIILATFIGILVYEKKLYKRREKS